MSDNDDFSEYGGFDYNNDGKLDANELDASDDDIKFNKNHHATFDEKVTKNIAHSYKEAPFATIGIILGLLAFAIAAIINLSAGIIVLIAIIPFAFILELIGGRIYKKIKNRKK